MAPDLGSWHRVVLHRDGHVQFELSLYSAPFTWVGKTLWLRATDMTVALHEDYRHLCTHLRAQRPGQRVTVRDHLPPDARAFFERDRQWCDRQWCVRQWCDRQWCVRQATAVGPRCAELVGLLLGDRVAERLRAAQGILGCAKTYGSARLEAACERALGHDSPHYRTVKTILATGADQPPLTPPHRETQHLERQPHEPHPRARSPAQAAAPVGHP